MADKQSLRATFFAFQKRERGGVLTAASIAFLVGALVIYAAFIGGLFAVTGLNPFEMQAVAMQAETDPGALQQQFGSPSVIAGVALLYLGFIFALCLWFAAYEAACLRWMIRGEQKGPFGFSLDADTWRVYGTYWAWLIFCVLGFIALMIILGVLGGVLGVLLGQSGAPSGAMAGLAVLPFLGVLIPIYFATRFAPAAAVSVAESRFKFFDAWPATKGRFWALFGAFFLLWIIYIVVAIGLTFAWLAYTLGPRASEIFAQSADPTAMSLAINQAMIDAIATPVGLGTYIGVQLLTLVIAMVFYVALFGINARAARAALEEGKITQAAA